MARGRLVALKRLGFKKRPVIEHVKAMMIGRGRGF
jgi:hypothetical protein